ncbi:MAG: hypothetical protein CSA45_02280 [Gammaproteobacteria bacterium]|nr:MAG: hypothetical protein CSA45_02280 [Gammaproteobacteria bacterium]
MTFFKHHGIKHNTESLLVYMSTLLIFAIPTIIDHSYSVGAVILFVAYLTFKSKLSLDSLGVQEKILISGFVVFSILSGIASIYHFELHNLLKISLKFFLAVFILIYLLQYPPNPFFFFTCCAIGAIGSGAISIYQLNISHISRPHGHINPIFFASITLCLVTFCLFGTYAAQQLNKKTTRYAYILLLVFGAIIGLAAVFLSASRGAWIAIPFVVLGMMLLYKPAVKYLVAIAMVLVVGLAVAWHAPQSTIKDRFMQATSDIKRYSEGEQQFTSVGARLDVWKGGTYLIAEKPIAGWGKKGASKRINQLAEDGLILKSTIHISHWHNWFIDTFVKQGVIGFIGVLILFIVPFALFYRETHRQNVRNIHRSLAFSGVLIVFLFAIFSLTDVILAHTVGIIFYSLSICYLWAMLKKAKETKADKSQICTERAPPTLSHI